MKEEKELLQTLFNSSQKLEGSLSGVKTSNNKLLENVKANLETAKTLPLKESNELLLKIANAFVKNLENTEEIVSTQNIVAKTQGDVIKRIFKLSD